MVHTYKLGGFNIVLDVCSGGIHVVDDAAYDIIEKFESCTKEECISSVWDKFKDAEGVTLEEIEECYSQIEQLKEEGVLFSEDPFRPMAGHLKEKTSGEIKALCLHVAHTCNLNCEYCFASQGKYHGERAVMDFETGKRALDFLVENSGSRHNLEVDFFGGEPLMNFDVVKELVAYARSIEKEKGKNFRFTLTTNGLLIDDDVIEFSNREMSNVVLSLDGRKEIHDCYRVDYAGNGSWDRIVPKFQKFVKERGDGEYYMRGTFTHRNPDFLEDIKTMLELGFDKLSMEPVVCAAGDPSELTEEDMAIVLDQYEKLAELMLEREKEGRPFAFYHYMVDIKGGPCIYKRISGCGSGTEYMAVTPWGDLYPCHQFVGEEKFKLGNIWDGVTNTEIQKEFASCNVYAHEECRDCWARFYCSGGCAANAYHATGKVTGIYKYGCELFKKRMECAIMLAVAKECDDE
ncbi:MAG: thioether cross-link-forming SCIFF peptide maturase [Ruminococcaceae bacterium]|nr:thioether cross-link-forming SCIFF peptide maturase [Oscillospiraceae bacterium]